MLELGRHEWFALLRLVTQFEMVYILRFLKLCVSGNLTVDNKMGNWKAAPRNNGAPIQDG